MSPPTDITPYRRYRVARWFLVAAAAAMAAACTRGTEVESAWTEGVEKNMEFSKVLVVGVTPDYNTRCRFERMMMDSLNGAEVRAVTSCSGMGSKDPLTRDAIVSMVASVGADAVLSTRLVDGKAKMVEGGSSETRTSSSYKAVGYGYDNYYGAFGVPVTYVDFQPGQTTFTLTRTIVVSSNLYEAKGAALVYTLDTTVKNKESQGDVIDAVSEAIADQLHRDGLVKK